MNRDNHDKQMLKAIQRIARSLESLVQIETLVHEDLLNEVGGEYMQGRIDAEEEAENRMNGILDDEKRLSYEQGRSDVVNEIKENIIPTLYEFDVMQDTIDFCVKCLEKIEEKNK